MKPANPSALDFSTATTGARSFPITTALSAAQKWPSQAIADLGRWTRRTRQDLSRSPVYRAGKAILCQSESIFPGHYLAYGRSSDFTLPRASRLVELSTRLGHKVTALFGEATDQDGKPLSDASQRPSVVFFYGNDMCLRGSLSPFALVRRLGVNVLMPDYIGYGLSQGKPSEQGCYATADAALDYLTTSGGVNPGRIAALGCSLGGAVAIDLASRRKLAGLATLVTFTSMADMARRFFPNLPSWLVRHRFESIKKMPRVTCPTLIGHSLDDRFIPHQMADRLAEAAGGPVERFNLSGADHSSTQMITALGDQIASALRAFIETYVAAA